MLELKVVKKKGTHKISFLGDATIYSVNEAVQVLRNAMAEATRVEVDLSKVSEMDSAFCQTLIAAQRQGERDGKQVVVVKHSDISEEMVRYYKSMGIGN